LLILEDIEQDDEDAWGSIAIKFFCFFLIPLSISAFVLFTCPSTYGRKFTNRSTALLLRSSVITCDEKKVKDTKPTGGGTEASPMKASAMDFSSFVKLLGLRNSQ
jgi:hypothetical protein